MTLGDNDLPQIEIERPPAQEKTEQGALLRLGRFDWRQSDPLQAAAQRRARRQGLILMIVSSLLTITLLSLAWVALRNHRP